MEVLPCARVAHIERTKKPYNNDIDYYAKRNALRAAEVWMDEFKSHVYMAWNIPMNNPGVDFGDVSDRVALRKKMNCRSFHWYLEHVYPEMRIYNNTITYGEVRNSKASGYCLDQGSEEDDRAILYPCHGIYTTEGLLQLGPLGSTTFLADTKCLVDDGRGRTPSLKKCDGVSRSSQRLWDFTQAKWTNHKSRHGTLSGGRNVQGCKLWLATGRAAMLRAEVDDSELDKASQTLKNIQTEK
ncbi:hypothetical protein DNTS_006216 [Danionella cerebrum]|uniref:Ricin B lectin domain-containing protein n=1 Tax=Danionella cerebrum TaxID=2873325 RepID=A0A553R460_9TELE|nr:hypothetical protein DNTS_006216 [Danionella translucida]